jgi:hypothetical protein
MSQIDDFEQRVRMRLESEVLSLREAGKSEREINEWVAKLIIEATEGIAPAVVRRLMRDAPKMLKEHRRFASAFERRLHKDWGAGLDLMYAVVVSCGEAGEGFYRRTEQNDGGIEALTGLHAQAWRIATETHVLLTHGFPSGAMARVRTMHELAVVASVISEFGKGPGKADLAEKYLLHGTVMAYKEALAFNQNASALGHEPFSDDELEEMRLERDALLGRFGKDFGTTYGWASALLAVPSPTFRDLESFALLSHLRPYYTWASHSVHADSRGSALNQVEFRGQTVMSAGAANVGLTDPAQLAMNAFLQCTVSLMSSAHDSPISITDQLAIHSILLLIKRASEELSLVEPKIMAREAKLHGAAVRGR